MTILQAKGLTKKYGSETIVNTLHFTLQAQKCVALIGPNGAGKTTTLRMLAGLIKPTDGTIFMMKKTGDFRQFIGYLPQHPVFYEWMTGEEYLIYVAKLSHMDAQTAKKHALVLLKETEIFEAKNKKVSTYSGGMKQRLGIAQAIIHNPKLLLLDEPVSALDPAGRREVLTLIEKLKQRMTILFSTHILNDAEEVCDEILLLHQGGIVESGDLNGLRRKYQASKIELTFSEEVKTNIHQKLTQLETVLDIHKTQQTYHLTVSDMKQARKEIFSEAAMENWELISFYMNQASLEDMFMKVVQS